MAGNIAVPRESAPSRARRVEVVSKEKRCRVVAQYLWRIPRRLLEAMLSTQAMILCLATLTLVFAINQGQPIKTLSFHHNVTSTGKPEWMTEVAEFDSLTSMAVGFIESFMSTNVRLVIWLISVIEKLIMMIGTFDPCAIVLEWASKFASALSDFVDTFVSWYRSSVGTISSIVSILEGFETSVDEAERELDHLKNDITCPINVTAFVQNLIDKSANCVSEIEESWKSYATVEDGVDAIVEAAENYGATACGPIGYTAKIMLTVYSFAFNVTFEKIRESGVFGDLDIIAAFNDIKSVVTDIAAYLDNGFQMIKDDLDLEINLDVFTNFGIQFNTNIFTIPSGFKGSLMLIGIAVGVLVLVVISEDMCLFELPFTLARNAFITVLIFAINSYRRLRTIVITNNIDVKLVWSDVAWLYALALGLYIVGFAATLVPGDSQKSTVKYSKVKLKPREAKVKE